MGSVRVSIFLQIVGHIEYRDVFRGYYTVITQSTQSSRRYLEISGWSAAKQFDQTVQSVLWSHYLRL